MFQSFANKEEKRKEKREVGNWKEVGCLLSDALKSNIDF